MFQFEAGSIDDQARGRLCDASHFNEIVSLQGIAGFDQIHDVNVATLEAVTASKPDSLEDLLDLDARSREAARRAIARFAA